MHAVQQGKRKTDRPGDHHGVVPFDGCDSSSTRHLHVTFHRIPAKKVALYYELANRVDVDRDSSIKNQWYRFRVCSRHFQDDFEINDDMH